MEAITRKKEVDEMKTFAKEHFTMTVTKLGPVFTLDVGAGWEQLSAGSNTFVSRNYIDLAGMTIDDKTAFFEAGGVQDVQLPSGITTAGDSLVIADLMTSKPLTLTEAASFAQGLGNLADSQANLTFDQTIYGRLRTFVSDLDTASANYMVLIGEQQLGSLEPTASDRVYSTRVIVFGANNTDGSILVYGCRHLLRATVKEEPEYQYLMRLKRSYELQNFPIVTGKLPSVLFAPNTITRVE